MTTDKILIKHATSADFDAVMEVEKLAFGYDKEAELVADLLNDKTAEPVQSLLAFYKEEVIGHILFTRVYIDNHPDLLMHILAPLAVKPEFQRKGIGGLLINSGLEILTKKGTQLVFVLGHMEYYPKYGFIPDAGSFGFTAPYPIPEEHANAWMVQELEIGAISKFNGKIRCADELQKPEHWRE